MQLMTILTGNLEGKSGPNRRSYVKAIGATVLVGISGCSTLGNETGGDSDDDREYAFAISNLSGESHTFHVRIGTEPNHYIHQEEVSLDSSSADEEIPFEGVPARLLIRIDDGDEYEFAWPASYSSEGRIATRAEIYYDPTNEQEVQVLGDS